MIFSGLEDTQTQWLSADSIISRGLWKDTVAVISTGLDSIISRGLWKNTVVATCTDLDSIISRGLWKDTVVATCTDLEDMLVQFYKWVDVGIPDPASADKLGQIDDV